MEILLLKTKLANLSKIDIFVMFANWKILDLVTFYNPHDMISLFSSLTKIDLEN